MKSIFKHPKIYDDLLKLYKSYWQIHKHLPRSFRMTTGETILKDITLCIKKVILANGVEKKIYSERVTAANHLAEVRANLVVTRGLLTLGWALNFISHGAFMSLTSQMDEIEKQTTKWHAWFMNWQQQ